MRTRFRPLTRRNGGIQQWRSGCVSRMNARFSRDFDSGGENRGETHGLRARAVHTTRPVSSPRWRKLPVGVFTANEPRLSAIGPGDQIQGVNRQKIRPIPGKGLMGRRSITMTSEYLPTVEEMQALENEQQGLAPASPPLMRKTKLRGHPRGVPFTWQSKDALRTICQRCQHVTSALAVYMALTWIGNDGGSDIFTTTHEWIAGRSGLTTRTVQDRIVDLEAIGLICVHRPGLRQPATYSLLKT